MFPQWLLFLVAVLVVLAILWLLGIRFNTEALVPVRELSRGWCRTC